MSQNTPATPPAVYPVTASADTRFAVESASQPGCVHAVDVNEDGDPVCDCKGYEYRSHCRHSVAVCDVIQARVKHEDGPQVAEFSLVELFRY